MGVDILLSLPGVASAWAASRMSALGVAVTTGLFLLFVWQ
jgi:hypothetical protein